MAEEAPQDDLRASIAAAMAGDTGTAETPPAAGVVVAPEAQIVDPATALASNETPTDERARAPDGKFVAKPAETGQTSPQVSDAPVAELAETQDTGTIRPPPTWRPEAKAAFLSADPIIQQEVLKRERETTEATGRWTQNGERLNRIDAVIAPLKDKWAIQGVDAPTGISRLVAAETYLERNPADGIRYLCQQYGVNPAQLLQQAPGQAQQPQGQLPQQAALPPELQGLVSRFTALEQSLTQQQQTQAQQARSSIEAEIQEFGSKPENVYFSNVLPDMASLLETGLATSIPDAYERAIWARPDIRPLILADRQKAAQAEATAAEAARLAATRAKASGAQRAAGSVIGSPGIGSSTQQAAQSTDLRETIIAAMADAS